MLRGEEKELAVTLMDTPGHVDFSAEMERTLQILDYAVLVINGTDGVQYHDALDAACEIPYSGFFVCQ